MASPVHPLSSWVAAVPALLLWFAFYAVSAMVLRMLATRGYVPFACLWDILYSLLVLTVVSTCQIAVTASVLPILSLNVQRQIAEATMLLFARLGRVLSALYPLSVVER